ncbi:hypothetical protein H3H32_18435 [Spirosoma foliorum]|uniref:Uncharacterized protein n=1 Tax=Spirosoma foliorum TaxID=2710596 RepID=A0A7G5H6I0_9BACT|nr:hypothetical protein H3H32_18435 [Spirosoma foliorum]
MAILISVLALLATFYQLYLQRIHNEKSLKPLGQIVLEDQRKTLAVHLRNNGLGPLIIDKLSCSKNGVVHADLEECLTLAPKSYLFAPTNDSVTRVVLPNSSLTIFETRFDEYEDDAAIEHAREQLAPITLKVEFRDIYDNKTTLERDFQWFLRYANK